MARFDFACLKACGILSLVRGLSACGMFLPSAWPEGARHVFPQRVVCCLGHIDEACGRLFRVLGPKARAIILPQRVLRRRVVRVSPVRGPKARGTFFPGARPEGVEGFPGACPAGAWDAFPGA